MKFKTKKKLALTKTWLEDELINTKNIIVCSTPPKEGEKFTGIGFLIYQNKQFYIVKNENGKCTPLKKMPKGWKNLHRKLAKDLICHLVDYGYNHKSYDKYNTYFNLLRYKLVKVNTLLFLKPFDIPFLTQVTDDIRKDTAHCFQLQQFLMHNKTNHTLLMRDDHYSKQITYYELLEYKNILNKKHNEYCQHIEKSYNEQKKSLKALLKMHEIEKEI